jgi:CheY-like chemotaxis protein
LGLVDYLVKPVTSDALLESVRAVAPDARTVLVTDDEPEMVRLLCRMLASASDRYRFLRAYDGEQALSHMRQTPPDLVLLDLLMPQVGGLAILEQMRADPVLAHIPVVVVSARGAFEAISPAAGRSLVLVADEPLPVSRLLKSVGSLLDALPPAELAGHPAVQGVEQRL